jgi:hypothetical protein
MQTSLAELLGSAAPSSSAALAAAAHEPYDASAAFSTLSLGRLAQAQAQGQAQHQPQRPGSATAQGHRSSNGGSGGGPDARQLPGSILQRCRSATSAACAPAAAASSSSSTSPALAAAATDPPGPYPLLPATREEELLTMSDQQVLEVYDHMWQILMSAEAKSQLRPLLLRVQNAANAVAYWQQLGREVQVEDPGSVAAALRGLRARQSATAGWDPHQSSCPRRARQRWGRPRCCCSCAPAACHAPCSSGTSWAGAATAWCVA